MGHSRLSKILHRQQQRPQQQQQQQLKKPKNERLDIIKELIEGEETHVTRLRLLDELFYRPMMDSKLMSDEQLESIFSCHRYLHKVHSQIYQTLITSYNTCDEPMIGAALLEIFEGNLMRHLERAARMFCVAQSTNSEQLKELTRPDTELASFIGPGIKELLDSCHKRLARYPVLLEDLLRATPLLSPVKSGDPEVEEARRMLAEERECIGRALHQSGQLLVSVNQAIKEARND